MHNKTIYAGKSAVNFNQLLSSRNAKEYSKLLQQKLLGFGKQLQLWNQRRKQRRELYALSDAVLKDIGVSRVDALREAEKPFWQP